MSKHTPGPDGEYRFRDIGDAVSWLESEGFHFTRDGDPSWWYDHEGCSAKLFLATSPDDEHLVYLNR